MSSHPLTASIVELPGADLPRVTARVVETPAGQVIGYTLYWEGGQCCALLTRRGMVAGDTFPVTAHAPSGPAVVIASGSVGCPLREPEDLLDAPIVAAGKAATAFGVRVGETGLDAIAKLLRADRPSSAASTTREEEAVRARVRPEDADAEYEAVRARLGRQSPRQRAPMLEISQILEWADAHHARTGEWPRSDSGFIREAPREKWENVNAALRLGLRGLPEGGSLARLLAHHRGVRNRKALPPYTEAQILQWADAHRARTRRWPTLHDGPIPEAPGETWTAVGVALAKGLRGLPGGSSIARLLAEHRRKRHKHQLPLLTEEKILHWADAHHARAGEWPVIDGGPVEDAPGETWCAINHALSRGTRGLPGGDSLTRLLARERGARHRLEPPPLSEAQILRWADAHRARAGRWPTSESGRIPESPDDTWAVVNDALRVGRRGLRGGNSLARLIREACDPHAARRLSRLSPEQILQWIDAHRARTGKWPHRDSGPIAEAPETTWMAVNVALTQGKRDLPGNSSLARFLAEHRGIPHRTDRQPLSEEAILQWADAYHERTGAWPRRDSGPIPESPGDTWSTVAKALYVGRRGLPGGDSLTRLLLRARGAQWSPRKPRTPRRGTPRASRLTLEAILAWADAHHERTGAWPTKKTGPIPEDPSVRWDQVDVALRNGLRGLPEGSSLARLLQQHRGVRNRKALPPLTEAKIRAWADAYHARTGNWPARVSGPIDEAPGESWNAVEVALRNGIRGLPGGSSLRRLLERERAQ
jgi:hypothetical protein